jgi:uncharacterized membrane protein YraQ (UPF0718 family)
MLPISLDPKIQDTITIFLAIVIEALPFIVLGVLVAAVLSAFIKDEWLLRLRTKNRYLSHVISACLGMLFPVCECGNVPVTRSLLEKGFSVSQAMSFYLGAPILNFVVIATTIAAFGGEPVVVVGRIFGGLVIASLVGIVLSFHPHPQNLLTPATVEMCEHHHHEHRRGFKALLSKSFVRKFLREFITMANLLVFGAALAAFTQLWLPRDFVFALSSNPLFATLAMMGLAVILSVCSTVDAFIALAYAGQFSSASILGFLLYGPMIDLKAISMLLTTFKPKMVALTVFLVTVFTLLFTLTFAVGGY